MNSLIPICVNCKYFLKEPTGQHRLTSACAISAIDPVTGEPTGKAKHAAQYRKDVGLCGPVGKYFQPGEKTVLKKEVPKPEVKTISVEVPEFHGERLPEIHGDNKFLNSDEVEGYDIVAASSLGNAEMMPPELSPEDPKEPKKRRGRRAK